MKLVTRYALPKLYNLEQQYGSFIRGTIAKAKQPKTDRDRLASKKVFSAAGGLDKLTGAMAGAIGPARITLSAADVTVRPCADKWMATYSTDHYCGTDNHNHWCLYIARPVAFRPERKDGADQ